MPSQATGEGCPTETQAMWGSQGLLLLSLALAAGGTEHVYRPGRGVCAVGVTGGPVSESFMQRVYQPFLTTCDGHRACSTYRTIYKTAYRRSPGLAPTRPRYACCPGWKRTERPPGTCRAAPCQPPCQNGGSCVHPGHCRCPAGWQGDACQEDVDECHTWGGGCPQRCINTAGSFWCQCWEGHSPSADGTFCLPTGGPHRVAPSPTAGMDSAVKEEVERLRSRVDVLEQPRQVLTTDRAHPGQCSCQSGRPLRRSSLPIGTTGQGCWVRPVHLNLRPLGSCKSSL
ncbi:epidermal growth factor-like protein 7 isoform X3 [Tupaia chinensis]|uniref:epidermal growth factor-like protein 7 isoform X3 n=1 Tax=Tupaia chinensis TaxID=246437 RepID=UPI0003C91F20|nr:epidermal growth factor-like protein 7 isoform X3 [Tupaia chinensis]